MIKTKIFSAAKTLSFKNGWKFLLSKTPRSATSTRILLELHRSGFRFTTIIDGGANVGQFARACHNFYPDAKIVAFEPLVEIAAQLRVNLKDVPSLRIVEKALGRTTGETDFHMTSNTQSSSVLSVDHTSRWMAGIETVRKMRVPMTTLDEEFPNVEASERVLLKLDLQGFELEALHGAISLLKACDAVLLEAAQDKAYVDEPNFHDIWQFMNENLYRFHRVINTVTDSNGSITQLDVLFVNCHSPHRNLPNEG